MSGLSAEDRDALYDWWDEETTVGVESAFPVVARIVARHVGEALESAARRVEQRFNAATIECPHDLIPSNPVDAERSGWLSGLLDAAYIVRDPANYCRLDDDPDRGVRIFLSTMRQTNPSPGVSAVLDHVEAELLGAPTDPLP